MTQVFNAQIHGLPGMGPGRGSFGVRVFTAHLATWVYFLTVSHPTIQHPGTSSRLGLFAPNVLEHSSQRIEPCQ